MVNINSPHSIYHILLIGIDDYQAPARKLNGCVNDIIRFESFLQGAVAGGYIEGELRITRMIAPRTDMQIDNQEIQVENLPDRSNIVGKLRQLASDEVHQDDKVLIYYAGHGHQWRPEGETADCEAIVSRDVKLLYDLELNVLINDIAARTTDLTVLLDCCHSASTFRDLEEQDANDRFIGELQTTTESNSTNAVAIDQRGNGLVFLPPDPNIIGLKGLHRDRSPGTHMLEGYDPDYVAIAACHAEEKAREGPLDEGKHWHGVFSYSFLQVLLKQPMSRLKDLRWIDIWSALLAIVEQNGLQLGNVQHPFPIGRMERKIFGGKWKRQDPGLLVQLNADKASYTIEAGTVAGITAGALLGIYGPQTVFFPVRDSLEDRQTRLLTLRVESANRATCIARPEGKAYELPEGARARLLEPGPAEALQVRMTDPNLQVATYLRTNSTLLEILAPEAKGWEIEVVPLPNGGWSLGDTLTSDLAQVPPGRRDALLAGLEAYYRFTIALRMVHTFGDPQFATAFYVHLLDAGNQDWLQGSDLADPVLPDIGTERGKYTITSGTHFVIKVANKSNKTLHFNVLNCTADGQVEYLGNESANAGGTRIVWRGMGELGRTFKAGTKRTDGQTDRLVVIATTRHGVLLDHMHMEQSVQEVIDKTVNTAFRSALSDGKEDAVPAELWAARLIEWYIKPEPS